MLSIYCSGFSEMKNHAKYPKNMYADSEKNPPSIATDKNALSASIP